MTAWQLSCVVGTMGLLAASSWQALSGEPGLQAWPVDPLVKVLRTDERSASPPKGVFIESARGDIESGQIAFRCSAGVAKLSASATSPKSLEGKELGAARVRFVGYVPIEKNTEPHLAETGEQVLVAKAPVELPDPLLEDGSIPVKAGQTGAVWLTVPVPDDAAPGT